jgi:hypothetical protein
MSEIYKVGDVYKRYCAYCDKYMEKNKILIGRKQGNKQVWVVGKSNDLKFYEEALIKAEIINKRTYLSGSISLRC